MGFNDRDYQRGDYYDRQPGFNLGGARTLTTNLVIAMAIATIKAGLVVTYFMHLRWDRPFHTLIFVGSLLFVSLFISMTLLDKSEYEHDIDEMALKKGQ